MLQKTIIPINDYWSQTINTFFFQNEQFIPLYLAGITRININIVKAKKFVFVGIFFIKVNYYIFMKNLKE